MGVRFSAAPGAWERHLQRKYNNPLFADADSVNQANVDAARRRDEQERQSFRQNFEALLHEVAALKAKVDGEVILALKARVDRLYEQGAAAGGDLHLELQGLRNLGALLNQSLGAGADSPFLQELEQEEAARKVHFELLEYPLIAHLLRPETPIVPDDIVPTLLSEDEVALRAALSLFDRVHQRYLYDAALELLQRLQSEDQHLPDAWARLKIIDQSMQQWH